MNPSSCSTSRQMCDMLRTHLLSVLLQSGSMACVFRKQESDKDSGNMSDLNESCNFLFASHFYISNF